MTTERFGAMDHPDEQVTASYLDGMLPPAARDRFEAHLSRCGHCREGLTLLAPLVAGMNAAGVRGEPVPSEFIDDALAQTAPASGRFRLMAAAAVVFMVAISAGSWWVRQTPGSDPAIYREAGERSSLNPRPEPGAVVHAAGLSFTWDPVEGADRYVVTVMRDELLLLTTEVPAGMNSTRWPADRPLPSPGRLRWQVKALALDRVVAQSRSVPFEVR